MGNALTIGRIAGIEIRVHATWLIIAALIGWTFYLRADFIYDVTAGEAAGLAVAGAVVFFLSILLHELSHSLMAKARGIDVRGITLFLFGGSTDADLSTRKPGDEFAVTVVGPLTSFGIAAVLWGAASAAGPLGDPVPGMIAYLAWLNLALGLFNLLPGFPLDGGRILRSATWKATGSLERATRIASTVGQFVGYALVAGGVLLFIMTGAGGLWLAIIGWFIAQAAKAERYETIGSGGEVSPSRRA